MNAVADQRSLAWFAVLTKPRGEATAMTHLQRQGFACLLPRVMHRRRGARGMQQSIEPLFPRYVFLKAQADGWTLGPVRSTRGVSGVVRFGGQAALVPPAVIDHLQARMDDDGCVALDVPELARGDVVRITEGPLSGMRAIFDARCGGERVRLLMELLGERVAVVMPRAQLATGFMHAWA